MNRPVTGVCSTLTRRGTVAATLLAFASFAPAPTLAADNGAPKWKVWTYNASNRALRGSVPAASPTGAVATFAFPVTPDTALLVTDHGSFKGTLLGDLTGKTVKATVSSSSGPFSYFGQGTPDNPCFPPGANARLFFQTQSSGSFAETDYWWSNPVSVNLPATSAQTMTVALTGGNWTDYFGKSGSDPNFAAAFTAAVANVTSIGVSFGGGCFFENGVGAPNGGSFTLNAFTVN